MPYVGESASKLSQVATARDPIVLEALGEYTPFAETAVRPQNVVDLSAPLATLDSPLASDDIRAVLAIDGSIQDTPIHADGARRMTMCFLRVGTLTLDLDVSRHAAAGRFVNPAEEASSRTKTVLNYVLPGVGVSVEGRDPLGSWRAATDRMLARCAFTDETLPEATGQRVTLADALLTLYGEPGRPADSVPIRACPSCGAEKEGALTRVERDGGFCPSCGEELFLADALGLDEVFATSGRYNALTGAMNAAERLALVCSIEMMRRRNPSQMARTLLVADGPMAAIGTIQRLARPMLRYLRQVASDQADAGLPPMLIAGVEKGGNFAGHGDVIADMIPPGHVMMLTGDYISRHITGRVGGRPYGAGHMYGRRFFYRRTDGQLLTVTVPAAAGVAPYSPDPASEAWETYPTLRPTLELLDGLADKRYRNAIQPLTMAHEASSLSMSADRVLQVLSQQRLGLVQNTRIRAENR